MSGRLFFAADDGTHGQELWVTDGTAAGTSMVKDILPGAEGGLYFYSDPSHFFALPNGRLLFTAADAPYGQGHGYELWSSDGTAAGTFMVKDARPGPGGAGSEDFTMLGNGEVLFESGDSNAPPTLLEVTDGTTRGTQTIARELTGAFNITGDIGLLPNGKAIFNAEYPADSANELAEPWVTDGTVAGTYPFKELDPAVYGPGGQGNAFGIDGAPILLGNGLALFEADFGGGLDTQIDLFATDGTAANTSLVKSAIGETGNSGVPPVAAFSNGTALFPAGEELWITDGTAADTTSIAAISPLRFLGQVNGDELFIGYDGARDAGGHGSQLWTTDGTSVGTSRLTDLIHDEGVGAYFEGFSPAANGGVAFIMQNQTDSALWITDGSLYGTSMLHDFGAVAGQVLPDRLANGDLLIAVGNSLWESNGTAGGTSFVTAFASGSYTQGEAGTLNGEDIVKVADAAGDSVQLFITDGTAAGTTSLGSFYAPDGAQHPRQYLPQYFTYVVDAAPSPTPPPPELSVYDTASFNAAIVLIEDDGPPGDYTIELGNDITLTASIAELNADPGVNIDIVGDGHTIDGAGAYQGFFVTAGNVILDGLTLVDMLAQGDDGASGSRPGGGGLGAGGALFVAGANVVDGQTVTAGGSVTLADVDFADNAARGGNGGVSNGQPTGAGGGGGGLDGRYGPGQSGFTSFSGFPGQGSGLGSTVGSKDPSEPDLSLKDGGLGGFGGGGGGGAYASALLYDGTYHGSGNTYIGGVGGFGGGGGGGVGASSGGFGGGAGVGTGSDGGAGGALGGDIFVQQGGVLIIQRGSVADGTVQSGSGGAPYPAAGSGLFLQGLNTVTFDPGPGQVVTVTAGISDQGDPDGVFAGGIASGVLVTGGGTVVLGGANRYYGNTTVDDATLVLNDGIALVAPESVRLLAAATLEPQGSLHHDLVVAGDADLDSVAASGPVAITGTLSGDSGMTLELTGDNAFDIESQSGFAGTIQLDARTMLAIGETNDAATLGTGIIAFGGRGTLAIGEQAGRPLALSSTLSDFFYGDTLDLRGITLAQGATATLAGTTLSVANGGTTYTTQLSGQPAAAQLSLQADSDNGGVAVTLEVPVFQMVSNEADFDSAIDSMSFTNAGTTYTIELGADISLSAAIDVLDATQGAPIKIIGDGHTIDGGGFYDGFFITAGTVAISNLTLANMLAMGGGGGSGQWAGGGGMGAGGALFIGAPSTAEPGASVRLDDVAFSGDIVRGGTGGTFVSDGQSHPGSGGGSLNGRYATGQAGGGSGGAGSGLGGQSGMGLIGGAGGFGGGGGGGGFDSTTGALGHGGYGGFGGGYAGPTFDSYGRSFGGGRGGNALNYSSGYGGAGAGGDIFVQQGATLSLGSGSLAGGRAYGGVHPNGFPGTSAGDGLFLQGTQTFTIDPAPGQTFTNDTDITDEGIGFYGHVSGDAASVMVTGGGTVELSGANNYFGATTVDDGTTLMLVDNTYLRGWEPAALQLEATGILQPLSDLRRDLVVTGEATIDTSVAPGAVAALAGTLTGDTGATLDVIGGIALDTADSFAGTVRVHAGSVFAVAPNNQTGAALGTGTIQLLGAVTIEVGEGVGRPFDFVNPILGFAAGDELVLTDFMVDPDATATLADTVLTVANAGTNYTFSMPGLPAGSLFSVDHNPDTTSTVVTMASAACYAAGTRILTDAGEVAIEDLREGDRIVTLLGGALTPVQWMGHRRIDCRRHPRPPQVWPVRVKAGAFGPDMPHRELRLSPDHAVFIAGTGLVPIRYLLNGATIVQEAVDEITYWHVELPRHDVILAEGLPAESYLDTGNRSAFEGNGEPMMLHPDFALRIWETQACARLVLDGTELKAARGVLFERAGSMGHAVTRDAALHVLVDGRTVWPEISGGMHRFRLPPGVRNLRLVSRDVVPAELGDDSCDHRRLGIAVSRILVDGRPIALDHPRLGSGWHDVESDSGKPAWRWTNGDAGLTVADVCVLEIDAAITERYWVNDNPLQPDGDLNVAS